MTSIDQIDQSEPHFGLGFTSPKDTPSMQEVYENEKRAIARFSADYKHKITKKATEYVDTMEETQRIQWVRKRTPHWYVTINPKPEVTVAQLHDAIVDMLVHEDISEPYWSYEQRSSKGGLHAHIYFRCDTTSSNFVQRQVKNKFVPNLCGTKKHVHVKWIIPDEVDAVKQYIAKKVVSKSKKAADTITKKWREDNNIPDILDEDHLLVWSSLVTQSDRLPIIVLN